MIKSWLKKTVMPLAIVIIVLAILSSLFRALTPWVTQYKGDIERKISTMLDQPVSIRQIETSWYWFKPVIKLDDVTLTGDNAEKITFSKLLIGINLFKSLWHWQIEPGILYLDDANLTLKHQHGHWDVKGINQQAAMSLEPDAYIPLLLRLADQEKIIIKHVSLKITLPDGSVLPIENLNLTTTHAFGRYRMKGSATLMQTSPTHFYIGADVRVTPTTLDDWRGQIYLAGKQVSLKQWRQLMPNTTYQLLDGKGDVAIWIDAQKGRVTDSQLSIALENVVWQHADKPKPQALDALKANVAWTRLPQGWQWTGDEVTIRKDGQDWPVNAFAVVHNEEENENKVYLKALPIETVLALDLPWPSSMEPVLALKPTGYLYDTQIILQSGKLNSFLAHFKNLGWQDDKTIKRIEGLSGVIHWEPTQGQLALNSENTLLSVKGYPTVTFDEINVALDWKKLNSGLRFSVDRFILTRPDLVLSASGAVDRSDDASGGEIRCSAELSGENLAQWLTFLPKQYMKPKLDSWLKQNIKAIEKGSVSVNLHGPLSSFPFDDGQGEFTINSYLTGVDFFINPDWPENKNVTAHLQLDKRLLTIDILRANLNDVLVDDMHLRIEDVGRGKEAVWVHSNIDALTKDIKGYIFKSPLKKRFEKLAPLDILYPVGLELTLEIPLYPEKNATMVRGFFAFDDNKARIQPLGTQIDFNDLTGLLAFDETGITDSQLRGTFANHPLDLKLESQLKPLPHTLITARGEVGVDWLQSTFYQPLLSVVQGDTPVSATYRLMNDEDLSDNLTFTSTLKGMSIDLPKPFGKGFDDIVPTTTSIDFATSQKPTTVTFHYDARLSGIVAFKKQGSRLGFDRGFVQVGPGKTLSLPQQAGLHVKGQLTTLDVGQWEDSLSKLSLDRGSHGAPDLSRLELAIADLKYKTQHFQSVSFQANQIEPHQWSIQLKQKQVVADLGYRDDTHTLSGHMDYLHLEETDLLKKQPKSKPKMRLKPKQIPNLDVTIDDFKVGDFSVGTLSVKSSSYNDRVTLDDGLITSQYYQMAVKGEWVDAGDESETHLETDLKVKQLEKLLESWDITPVVEADNGRLQFQGSWPGAIDDFSLETTHGAMDITLKNGRITHLDPETEQKIGLGKLLSILSLQTIPRRLKLDFSDLAEDGYTFDVFKGHFTLLDGVLHTNDSFINGPVAYASMKGDLDVVKRLYDIDLRVSPYITASLPVVATIAGGPVAGIATWVASNLITKGMQKISAYTYKISGPWTNPVVQQVHIYRSKQTSNTAS